MSRINYCDEEDFQNQSMLWEANQERSIRGLKGQAALHELEAALLALPEKRLIANELENVHGEVCAIGALAKFKGKENPQIGDSFGDHAELSISEFEIEQITVDFAEELGVPRMVALAIVHENDEWRSPDTTPENRYNRVLRWTRDALSGKYGWLTKKEPKAVKAHQRYKQVFDFICAYSASNHEAPTMTEIGRHVGLSSTASVFENLIALEALGLIRRTRKWRGIEIVK